MSIIKVENLTFHYPNTYNNIFENTSFVLDTAGSWVLLAETVREKQLF